MKNNKSSNDDALVLIPIFNEANNINILLKEVKKYFNNILVVNDGSLDEIDYILEKQKVQNCSHIINLGQGAAIDTGLNFFIKNFKYKYVITFDGDGQHLPIDAHKMLQIAKDGNYKAVIGTRFKTEVSIKQIPFLKRITLRLARIYEQIFYGIKLSDAHNGLRVFERDLVIKSILPVKSSGMFHATEISYKISRSGFKFIEYPVFINYKNKKSQSPINAINILINNIFYH